MLTPAAARGTFTFYAAVSAHRPLPAVRTGVDHRANVAQKEQENKNRSETMKITEGWDEEGKEEIRAKTPHAKRRRRACSAELQRRHVGCTVVAQLIWVVHVFLNSSARPVSGSIVGYMPEQFIATVAFVPGHDASTRPT